MSKIIIITLDTGNDAFQDDDNGRTEIVRLLDDLAETLRNDVINDREHITIRDINGNTVGGFRRV